MKKLLGLVFLFIVYFISPANAEWEGSCYIEYDGQVVVDNEICSIRQNGFSIDPTSYKHIDEADNFQIVAVRDVPCDDGSKDCAYYFYADKFTVTGETLYQINYNIEKERTKYPANLGEDFKISKYKPNDTGSGLCFIKDKDKFCFAYVFKGVGEDNSNNKSFEDYSILIEEGNDSVMLTYRYPSNFEPNNSTYSLEILDYGKFEFNRIAYINAKNNETPIFIQPSNLAIESDYKSLMQPKYQIDNVGYEYTEDSEKQIIKIKSTDNNLRIHNKIEEYFNNKSELSATILSGGVYAANKFLPVTNIEQLKGLFKNNPQTFCRLLSEKNISDKTNRELKSDLKSLLTDEIKKCEDKNIIINITSNKYLESNTLPSLICEKSSRTGASDDMLSFELSDKAEYKILKISNSEIKFNFGRGEYYILGNLDIETSKLGLMLFDDSNYKNLVGSKRYICDKEIEITQRIVENSEPDIAWKADDKFIIPECFDYVWLSGDKYETFFNEYIEKLDTHREDPRFQNFIVEIGTYLNREVPLNHSIDIDWSGYPSISLTKKLKGCFSDKPQTFVTFLETYYWKDGTSSIEETYISYEVLESYDLKIAKKLAPHIKQEFESIKKVSVKEWSGGSMGPKYHTATYGLITIDGEKVLLPLKNHIKY
ncbi:hypothetical protein OAB38_00190 [bacterium]|nr:hypothetical protein [bacterium]